MSFEDWQKQNQEIGTGFESWQAENESAGINLPTGGTLEEFGKGLVDTFLQSGKGAVQVASKYSPVGMFMKMAAPETHEEFYGGVSEKIEQAREPFEMTHRGTAAKAGRILGNAVGYMGQALAGGVVVGPIGAAMVGFNIEGQNAYDEAKASGATEFQAESERLIVGSINAAIEALQIGRLMKFSETGKHSVKAFINAARTKSYKEMAKVAKPFGADVLKSAIENTIEGFTQEGVSITVPAVLRGNYPTKEDGSPDWWAIGEQMGAAGLAEGFAGGILGGGKALIGADVLAPSREKIEGVAQKIRESDLSDRVKGRMIKELEKLSPEKTELQIPESARKVLDLADNVAETLKEMQARRPELAEHIKTGRKKSFAQQVAILEKTQSDDPIVAKQLAQATAKGELRKDFPNVADQFSQEDWRTLVESINTATDINEGERRALWETLDDLFIRQKPPGKGRLKLFDKFFGTDIISGSKNISTTQWQQILRTTADVMNVPKAILASFDVSMPLRQAWHYTMSHPIKSMPSWGKMLKAFVSNKYSEFIAMEMQTHPNYDMFVKAGLEQTKPGSRTGGEEYFQGELAHRIPGIGRIVKASERAAVTYMNSIRLQAANHFYELMGSPDVGIKVYHGTTTDIKGALKPDSNGLMWVTKNKKWASGYGGNILEFELPPNKILSIDKSPELLKQYLLEHPEGRSKKAEMEFAEKHGYLAIERGNEIAVRPETLEINRETKISPKAFQDMIDFVNHSTSRGGFKGRAGKWFKKWSPELGAVFWTPKMIVGKVQSIADIRKSEIRKLVACETLRAFGGATLAAMLLALGFGGKFGKDPRSSDFGKVIIGKTRLDLYGTYLPMFRVISQLVTGERKAATTGRISDVERKEVVTRFLRSKLNPMAGVISDVWTGQTFLGKKMKYEGDFLAEYIYEHVTPLFLQDLGDAIKYQGWDTLTFVAPLAVHGAGAATYEPTPRGDEVELKNHYAKQAYGKGWDEIGPAAQKVLKAFRPEIVKAEEKTRATREDYTFIGKLAQEQQDAGKRVQKKLSKSVQKEMDRLGVSVGGLSRNLKRDWYLNKKRYNQYQNELKVTLDKAISNLISNPSWYRLNDDVQAIMLETTVDQCKKLIRQRIVNQANIKDLEQMKR